MMKRYIVLARIGACEWRQAWETNDADEARRMKTIVLATGEIKHARIVDRLNVPWYERMYNYCLSLVV
jgi:hypothetical protein